MLPINVVGVQSSIEIVVSDPASRGLPLKTTIRSQVNAGVYVSRHLLGRAVDVRRRGTNLAALNDSVRSINGRLSIEPDHYHVDF